MASDKGKKSAKTVTAIPANDDGTEKKRALDIALAGIEKQFGKGAVIRMGERAVRDIQVIPTGCLDLDMALGVDVDQLYVSQPDTGEQALEICEALVRSGAIDVVVIDSVAALVPKAEIDGEMGDSFVGLQARLMSQALRKLTGIINKTNSTCIFINQLREKVGVMYGNPETTPGGRALKFYASVRIDIRRGEQLKDGTTVVGNRTKAKIVKNKVAPPFRTAEFDILYGEGISKEGSLLDSAVALDIIHKSGAWFSYGDQRIGQGRENTRKFLKENAEIAAEIDKLVRAELMGKDAPVVQSAADDDERPTDDGMDDLPNLDDEE